MRILILLLPTLVGCGAMRAMPYSSTTGQSVATGVDGSVVTVTPSATPTPMPLPTPMPASTPSPASATTCPNLIAKLNTDADATADLQACIDAVPNGATLTLPVGYASVSRTVTIAKAITVRTAGLGDAAACPSGDAGGCFEIRGLADATPTLGSGLLTVTGTGATVRNVVINGNRIARLQSDAADQCRSGNNGLGANLLVDGQSIRIEGIVSKNALCATGFAVKGKALQINRNLVMNNGQHGDSLWSDGITVLDAADSSFVANQVRDNSDVDFIFGGCQRCVIRDNVIAHSSAFGSASYAAFMFHAWPDGGTSGDYTGTEVTANQIDCGPQRRCGFGLYLGAESWYTAPLFGGYWHDNQVTNALTGFLVERPSGLIRIKDNVVTNSGGATLTNAGDVTMGYAYNIPFREAGVLSIEDTKIPLSAYAQISMSRKIPLDPSRDVAYTQAVDNGGRPLTAGSFVLNLFRTLLKRQPSHAEVESYRLALTTERQTRADVLHAFRNSDEYLTAQVNSAYSKLLNRPPDPGANATWFAYLRGGALIQQMWVEIATSPEALGHDRTDFEYATAMYRYLLGRAGSSVEVANLAAALGPNRAATMTNFIASAEMSSLILNDEYAWLLNRPVDSSGAASWIAYLAQGNSVAALESAIASTPEARD